MSSLKKFCANLTCGITFNCMTRRRQNKHFQNNLWNCFVETRDHLTPEYSHNGSERIPKSLKLGIKTRKGNLKSVFAGTIELSADLRMLIESEGTACRKGAYLIGGLALPKYWKELYELFLEKVRNECKIHIENQKFKAACTAIRKVSAINLIVNFLPVAGDDD